MTDHPIVELVGDWNYIFFEGPSRLINDDTGETVGLAVTESMDVRIMQNAPYGANQH